MAILVGYLAIALSLAQHSPNEALPTSKKLNEKLQTLTETGLFSKRIEFLEFSHGILAGEFFGENPLSDFTFGLHFWILHYIFMYILETPSIKQNHGTVATQKRRFQRPGRVHRQSHMPTMLGELLKQKGKRF